MESAKRRKKATEQNGGAAMNTLQHIQAGCFPVIVAFSGGKDSIAMALYLLENGIAPERIHLHHHDVDGGGKKIFDWACTASYCQAFADALGLKLFFSYREGGILREILRENEPRQNVYFQAHPGEQYTCIPSNKKAINTRLKFPAVSANLATRWCSSTVKIDVLGTVIRYHPAYSGTEELFILTGERRQESAARSKYNPIELHRSTTKKRKSTLWRPILDWDEHQVWGIMERWKIQPHPCYMLGWNRCSCQLCIFGSPNIWASIYAISPEKVETIAATEQLIQFSLYSKQTIYERVGAGSPFTDMSPYWIKQATSEFTAPILVDNWVKPAGAFKTESAGAY
jgi:3'-phosphoadenosine 5'-phosphosulfate sulfotransferase (PAPS reductase)/FAD synthetase